VWQRYSVREQQLQIRLDQDVNALYITVRSGRVSKTLELTDSVYVDLDAKGKPIGIEFVNADEFLPFIREHANDSDFPAQVRELFKLTAA
jgi:uncharacterized protein YuzE